jgi:NADPH-dependent 2,4-dienoyl-CoA reductase/sulfur reductase-like enzyme
LTDVDVLVVGAGPAGMTAAVTARRRGLSVMVVDEQPAPGGQIWRSVEAGAHRDDVLGSAFSEGRPIAAAFRASGVLYEPDAQIWLIERGFRVYVTKRGVARVIGARAIVLATGAQERPVPFPGWTLPGVLTVGAAQILLKGSGQIPTGPVWIAGNGPLPLLYATQLLRAGGSLAGFLDTTPAGRWRSAVRHVPGAVRAAGDLLKGIGWTAALRRGSTRFISGVTDVEAGGEGRLERVRYKVAGGDWKTCEASVLLVHEGVVPNIHVVLSLGCDVVWNEAQSSFAPKVDEWGETTVPGVYVTGDGAGIGGAKAALKSGAIVGIGVATRMGVAADANVVRRLRRELSRELYARPLLDALYAPRRQILEPADDTIVCRCEEVTAGEIRALGKIGHPGPNQIKAASRAGMGPCQGRQCGYTITRILAEAQGRTPADVGYFNIRSPLKPVTLGELASLVPGRPDDDDGTCSASADAHDG